VVAGLRRHPLPVRVTSRSSTAARCRRVSPTNAARPAAPRAITRSPRTVTRRPAYSAARCSPLPTVTRFLIHASVYLWGNRRDRERSRFAAACPGESAPGRPTPAVLTGGTQAPGSPGAGGADEGWRGRVASLRQRVTSDRQRGRRGDPTDRLLVGQFRSGGNPWRCPGASWRTAGGGSG
jgi:hypothetical protein